MLKLLPAPDHVLALQMSGKLMGSDIEQYRRALAKELAKEGRIHLYVDFDGLSDMNANAMTEGAMADLELLPHLDRFDRCAYVSDKEWPQALIGFIGPLLPGFEMKVFPTSQSEQAMKWASEKSPAPAKAKGKGAFSFIPTSENDVFAFQIDGKISAEEMPAVIAKIDTFLEGRYNVRMLNRVKHFGGFDPSIFMQSGLLSMKMAALKKVERYAIVGAPGWMANVVKAMNPIFYGTDMKIFPADKEGEAWAWVGAQPVD